MQSSKSCFVPSCSNTNVNSQKIFVPVPRGNLRQNWCFAVGQRILSSTYAIHCCEDHFDMETDCENWTEFKFTNARIKMKKGVIPHRNIDDHQAVLSASYSQLSPNANKRRKENMKIFESKRVKIDNNLNVQYSEPASAVSTLPTSFMCDKGIQANIKLPSKNRGVNTCIISFSKSTSPIKFTKRNQKLFLEKENNNSSYTSSLSSQTCEHYTFSSADEDSEYSEISNTNKEIRKMGMRRLIISIEQNSRFYLGLPQDVYFLIKLLETEARVNYVHLLIILKKIRLNDPFFRLALDFGYSQYFISKIFNKNLSKVSAYMRGLIFWPEPNKIKLNLPIPFRYRYRNVQSIIDCLEIEIQKPTKAINQALTWSNYKKTNTLKYLISSTPDGFINFISDGFGGRITDKEIIEASNYLNVLPNNCDVMADRGFKTIGGILQKKGCNLIRPPSVQTAVQSTKQEVKESKRIASLRIHIERVIRRLREFGILKGHACIDHKLVPKTDSLINIACGIVNLQGTLIK